MVKLRITNPATNLSKIIDATKYTFREFEKTVLVYAKAGFLVKIIRN